MGEFRLEHPKRARKKSPKFGKCPSCHGKGMVGRDPYADPDTECYWCKGSGIYRVINKRKRWKLIDKMLIERYGDMRLTGIHDYWFGRTTVSGIGLYK